MPKKDTEPDQLVEMLVAMARTGLSADTLRRYEREGRLTSIRTPGGHRRYRMSDLDALMGHAS